MNQEFVDALYDILNHIDNVVELRGHGSVVLGQHPLPCCELDFCVMHHMNRLVKKARSFTEATPEYQQARRIRRQQEKAK
jgi:hypothetical protein